MEKNVSIEFSSNFECGNGTNFKQVGKDCWELELSGDIIYGPWYNFKVANKNSEERQIELIIRGIPSLPGIVSQADVPVFRINDSNWKKLPRAKIRIVNTERKRVFQEPITYYWEKEVEVPKDRNVEYKLSDIYLPLNLPPNSIVQIAATYPYDYSTLLDWLNKLLKLEKDLRRLFKVEEIGKTEEGRTIYLIQLTNPEVKEENKQVLLITARMHPSLESSGSFGVEGIVEFLLSRNTKASEILRDYIINIIPMCCIDGIVHGDPHYDGNGIDLWHDFIDLKAKSSQAIFKVMQTLNPDFYIDFHGWVSHDSGEWPYDGAYFNVKGVDKIMSTHYEKMIDILKSKVYGFASYALFQFLGNDCPNSVIYDCFHTPSCVIEINPGLSSIEQVKERAVDTFITICDILKLRWEGYPNSGTPNREIKSIGRVTLFAWGRNYKAIRNSRKTLWQKRESIDISYKESHSKIIINVNPKSIIEVDAAVRIQMPKKNIKERVTIKDMPIKSIVKTEGSDYYYIFVPLPSPLKSPVEIILE
jgi:hypothetical protein